MPRRWRLLVEGRGSGPWNMSVDETLLDGAVEGAAPTLRLYTWQGPWLSVGYAQALDTSLVQACARNGVGIVRRTTGGRAVLHGGDLTYAVAAPRGVLPEGVRASHALIAEALLGAVRVLGVEAQRAVPEASSRRASFDCFEIPAADELCVGGRKLAGSAQRRRAGAVLEHGSLRLVPDPVRAARAARIDPRRATSLAECGFLGGVERACDVLVCAFRDVLGGAFEAAALTPGERAQAVERARERAQTLARSAESPSEPVSRHPVARR